MEYPDSEASSVISLLNSHDSSFNAYIFLPLSSSSSPDNEFVMQSYSGLLDLLSFFLNSHNFINISLNSPQLLVHDQNNKLSEI